MAENISQSKKAKIEKQNAMTNKVMFIPIIVLLAIIPLIVRLDIVYPQMDVASVIGSTEVADFFSVYKASGITLVTIAMIVMCFLFFQKEFLKWDKHIMVYMICAGVFLIVSLAATVMSTHSHTAWWGMPDRSEGMVMTACYIIIFAYSVYVFRNYENFKAVIISLSIVILGCTFLGVFQYFGHDLLVNEPFFQSLVVPKAIAEQINGLSGLIDEGKIYGTMFHYNYMGSFGAMMVPLFVVLTLFVPGKKRKIFLAIISLAAMFLLFGSTSRAGLIGLVLAVICAIIVFAKQIIRKWKLVLPVILVFVIVLFGFNAMTNGSIFSRIPTLVNDAVGLLGGSDQTFDYKEHIPVKAVDNSNGEFTIVLQNGSLTMKGQDQNVYLFDGEGNQVVFEPQDGTYMTTDERFKDITFIVSTMTTQDNVDAYALQVSVQGKLAFILMLDANDQLTLINPVSGEPMTIEDAPAVGFKGKEKLGSARGYIWSRSIPLLKNTWLIGNGPDTFALNFPQNDYLAKWWAYGTPRMIVDKAHSLYFEYAINNGGLALVAFLVLVIGYIVDCFRLYGLRRSYETKEAIGVGLMLAVIGYLGAGFFNDSIVSVTPIFWTLLGIGVAINFMINKERKELQKRAEHGTIDMKTRKHLA